MEAKLILTEVMVISGDGSKIWTNQNINLQFDQSALDKLAAFCESDAKNEPVTTFFVPVTPEMFEHRFDAVQGFVQEWLNSPAMAQWAESVEKAGMFMVPTHQKSTSARTGKTMMKLTTPIGELELDEVSWDHTGTVYHIGIDDPDTIQLLMGFEEERRATKPQPKTKVTVWRFGSTWSIQAATQEAYDWIKDKASEFGRLYPNEGAHLSFGFEPNANFDANEVQSYFVGLGELCPQEEERPLTNPPE